MGKKNKKNIKKDKNERLKEVIDIIRKLNELGLNNSYEEIQLFISVLKKICR